ncbi:MAG TPA: aldo/keto reductase [Firmicutes bacterium]|nr:aldo/keto reductase [Bacillota bacterium]HHY97469.1 aldo/keto reductase [Bacillota bacterium]
MRTIVLKSGDEIPILGLGTWQVTGDECQQAVQKAIELGYVHIDTAAAYGNHKDIALAIKKSGIDRDKLFITSKVWRDSLRYKDVLSAGEQILTELGIEYLNLLLIHWPNKEVPISETLRGLAELKARGMVRNIGVSNFTIRHLTEAMEVAGDLITVNQVEFHPYLYQRELLEFCRENNIVLTAYSPMARGRIFNDQVILDLADKYVRSPSQLVLRWLVEKGIVVIPKATSEKHLRDNMEIFGWTLPDEAREKIDSLNRMERLINPSFGEFDY